jgi:tRNA threonylcarbamoyladenosine biosynthesis protein TsaE
MIWFKKVDEKSLKALAYGFGTRLKNKKIRIGLVGNLGSGKTTFTKSLARALGIKNIKSPSFIIASSYKFGGGKEFVHGDLYRLQKSKQLPDTGLLNQTAGITVIEWADKFKPLLSSCDVVIKFLINRDGTRDIKIY